MERVGVDGSVERLVDVSASQGHVVPASIAYDGNFYVGNLGTFPITPGAEHVFKITPNGRLKRHVSGLTTAMTFGPDGGLYISNVGFGPYPPNGAGQILRVTVPD